MSLKNRELYFAKNCVNDHGRFAVGDRARGGFSDDLVASYLAVGILIEQPSPPADAVAPAADPAAPAAPAKSKPGKAQ